MTGKKKPCMCRVYSELRVTSSEGVFLVSLSQVDFAEHFWVLLLFDVRSVEVLFA
jgi:hypothetical protein